MSIINNEVVMVLSSSDLPEGGNIRSDFEQSDPPPLGMKVKIDQKLIDLSVDSRNQNIRVYLSKYILDCVWRDSENPAERLTSNAGTSMSRRLAVYLYAGDTDVLSNNRLLQNPIVSNGKDEEDPDFYIYRDQNYINEKAHNLYDPNIELSSDLYLENQYTQQSESFVMENGKGVFLGILRSQAIIALRSTNIITIKWNTDRKNAPSPFWYNKFLTGSSLWNPQTRSFDVQVPGTTANVYYKQVGNVSLLKEGGPYIPSTLYTLNDPINLSIAPFINNSNLENVTDPIAGEICTLNNPNVTMHLSQLGLTGTTDLGAIKTQNIPTLAPSDESSFQVPVYNVSTKTTNTAFSIHTNGQPDFPARYTTTTSNGSAVSSVHFPNGEWRGESMTSSATALGNQWHSPFPWEKSLTSEQLNVVNEVTEYNVAFQTQIVNCDKYLFMDPGTTWDGHTDTPSSSTCTIGERSLQFDFGSGRNMFVNKFQLLFPRSQEDHQPYRMQASIQKQFRNGSDNVVESSNEAFWFGGIQFQKMTGSASSPENYTYLNTLSQTTAGLTGSFTNLWDVQNRTLGSNFISPSLESIIELTPQYDTSTTARGRKNVVTSLAHLPKWFRNSPNTLNPAFDFQRQEFGPYVQGATLADMKDGLLCKAWTEKTSVNANVSPIYMQTQRVFFDLVDYLMTSSGQTAIGGGIYVKQTSPQWLSETSVTGNWKSLTSSYTGSRLAAVGQYVWTYNNNDEWVQQLSAGNKTWTSISSTGTGQILVATALGEKIWRSQDYGVTWATIASSSVLNWKSVVVASDGLTAMGVVDGGYIYKYTAAGGKLYPARSPDLPDQWVDISFSANTDFVVAISEIDVYVSTDKGNSWNRRNPPSNITLNGSVVPLDDYWSGSWISVAISADGQRIVLASDYGSLLIASYVSGSGTWNWEILPVVNSSTSTNVLTGQSYQAWTKVIFAGGYTVRGVDDTSRLFKFYVSGNYYQRLTPGRIDPVIDTVSIASSSNGNTVIASIYEGSVYISSSDVWSKQTALPTGSWWTAVAISADGTSVAAVAEDGYVYIGNASIAPTPTSTFTWRTITSIDMRYWNAISLSNDGQVVYAGVYGGYLYGSLDNGVTWTRDVSPIANNEYWSRITVKSDRGFAIAETGTLFGINISGPSTYTTESVTAKTSTNRAWNTIDSSKDGEIVVAAVYNGSIYVSNDSGETWNEKSITTTGSTTIPSTGKWTCCTVSINGRQAVVMADTGHIAVSFTTDVDPYYKCRTWTLVTTYTSPVIAWTSVRGSDDFTSLVATASGKGIYLSTNRTTWTYDPLLSLASSTLDWSCVTVSPDGAVSAAGVQGSPSGAIYRITLGDAYTRLTPDRRASVLSLSESKLWISSNLVPSFFLVSEALTYGVDIPNSTFVDVYVFFQSQYNVYRVDCDLTSNPSSQQLMSSSPTIYRRNDDGTMVIYYDTAVGVTTPSKYIIDTYVAVGSTKVLVAQNTVSGILRTHLIHPWYVLDSRQKYVLDSSYTKYILPSPLIVTKTTFAISAAANNHQFIVYWQNLDILITIPDGTYNVSSLNGAFHTKLDSENLYTLDGGGTHVYYMRFVEVDVGSSGSGGLVELQIDPVPRDTTTNTPPGAPSSIWPYPSSMEDPGIKISSLGGFGDIVGFLPTTLYNSASKRSDYLPNWVTPNLSSPVAPSPFNNGYDIHPQLYTTNGTLEPKKEYVVKESYYFTPRYDQYDTKQTASINGQTSFQPRESAYAQKMVNVNVATGQYLGVAFGSFLYDSDNPSQRNEVYTRGRGNMMKLFSFRPMSQMFSFQTDSGFMRDLTNTSTTQATFKNTITKGVLSDVAVEESGAKYFGRDTTKAYLHPTLDLNEEGYYYDETSGKFADTSMFLLDKASNEIVKTVSQNTIVTPRHAEVDFDMVDDTSSLPVKTYTASSKTSLRRSAEMHLRFEVLPRS